MLKKYEQEQKTLSAEVAEDQQTLQNRVNCLSF